MTDLAVDPTTSPSTDYASVGSGGVFKSTDGGKTWQLALAPTGDHDGAVDVALQPGNPHVILASMWDHYRNNGSFYYGGVDSGLYRSTDDGKSWTRLDNSDVHGPVCSWDSTKSGLNADADLGHIGMAFAPTDPNRAYIVFAQANGPDKGFYVSNDGGATWTCGGGEPGTTTGGYEWVFSRLWVDPADANHVFAADVDMRETADGGNTWVNNTAWSSAVVQPKSFALDTLHADQHAMAWDPSVPKHVFAGNDGGVYASTTNGDQPNGQLPTSSPPTSRCGTSTAAATASRSRSTRPTSCATTSACSPRRRGSAAHGGWTRRRPAPRPAHRRTSPRRRCRWTPASPSRCRWSSTRPTRASSTSPAPRSPARARAS